MRPTSPKISRRSSTRTDGVTVAAEQFKNALELNPLDPGTYHRRGESLEVQGNLGGAAADYRRAVEIIMNLPASGDEV